MHCICDFVGINGVYLWCNSQQNTLCVDVDRYIRVLHMDSPGVRGRHPVDSCSGMCWIDDEIPYGDCVGVVLLVLSAGGFLEPVVRYR